MSNRLGQRLTTIPSGTLFAALRHEGTRRRHS